MNEEQTGYKVTDRRLFNPDGTPREVPPEEKPEPKKETATASSSAAEPPVAPEAIAPQTNAGVSQQQYQTETSEPERAASADAPSDELPGADDPASFTSFMMSIASNAAASLGMMEHPITGKRDVDLELGKHWIDVLGMLQQKTRGNLLTQEQQLLESLLADLRMQYVSLTTATTSKPRAYSSRDITGGN